MNSCQKGKRGEREAAELLRSHGVEARRGQQFSGSPDSPDVVHDMAGFHIEVKRVERLNIYNSMLQAQRDAGPGQKAVVLHKANRRPWMIIMLADDLIPILKQEAELNGL